MANYAVCQDDDFWAACDWTTYDGTVITNATERDAYYTAKYTSLQAWDNVVTGEVPTETTVEIIGPWTSPDSAARVDGLSSGMYTPLLIVTVGVARPGNVNSYRITSSTSHVLFLSCSYVIIDGVTAEAVGAYACFLVNTYYGNVTFRNCIAINGTSGYRTDNYNGGMVCVSCVASGQTTAGYYGGRNRYHERAHYINCTAYSCNIGFSRGYYSYSGSSVAINCISVGCTGDCFDDVNSNFIKLNCISSDATSSAGTSDEDGITGVSAASVFTDPANGDFTLRSNSPARGAGRHVEQLYSFMDGLSTPTRDLIGNYRHPTPDIGALEYDDGYIPGVELDITGMIEGSVLAIYRTSDHAEIVAPTVIGASGAYSTTYAWTGNVPITVVVRKATGGTKYLPYSAPGLITSGGFGLVVSQVEDLVLNG